MTAREFAAKIKTPYPTVAAWLRDDGKREKLLPGAYAQEIGGLKIWMIPASLAENFAKPSRGRPRITVQSPTQKEKTVKPVRQRVKKARKSGIKNRKAKQ